MKILPPMEEGDTMIAALGYPFWYIVSPLILFTRKREEPFMKYHALQALIFGAALVVAQIILFLIMIGIFSCVPSLKGIIRDGYVWKGYMEKGCFFLSVFVIVILIYCVMLSIVFYFAYKAFRGDHFRIPFIGVMLEKKYFSYLEDPVAETATSLSPQSGTPSVKGNYETRLDRDKYRTRLDKDSF
ncbi:MAG: DUF4870 domain-containing protein [Candidatus Xenobiia bacterium LiM19]